MFFINYFQKIIEISFKKVSSHFWIGITDSQEEGKWVYSSDGSEVEVANSLSKDVSDWNKYANLPDKKDSNDCAYWWEAYGGGWMDTKCTSGSDPELNYVCEKGKSEYMGNSQ